MKDIKRILQERWDGEMIDPDRIFVIPSYRIPELEKRVSTLNKRMKSGMVGGLTIEIVSKETKKVKRDQKEYAVEYTNCKLIGSPPVLEGWELIAVVDHRNGNLVRTVPGKELPAKFRDVDPRNCDHCKVDRFRNETVILKNVENDDEYVQVGKSCLKDFLGHTNPAIYFKYAEMVFEIGEMLGDAELEEPELGQDKGSRGQWVVPLKKFLNYVAMCARMYGYMSKTNAQKYNDVVDQGREYDAEGILIGKANYKTSSANMAIDFMYPDPREKSPPTPTIEDEEFAQRALEFMQQKISDKENSLSDFEYNLKQLISMEEFPARYAGYVAAVVGMYKREIEGFMKREKRGPSEYVGSVGDKIEIVVTVAAIFGFETQYGYSKIVKMIDDDGNEFKWMTSSDPDVDQGDRVKIKATIKEHDMYKGIKQTKIVRAKVVERLGDVEESAAAETQQRVNESTTYKERIRKLLIEATLYITKKELPPSIAQWVIGRFGNVPAHIQLIQGERVVIDLPWHEAAREYYQAFEMIGPNTFKPIGETLMRSGSESFLDYKHDETVDIPSGGLVICYLTYPKQLRIFTGEGAQPMIVDKTPTEDLDFRAIIALHAAKSLKSFARPKFDQSVYDELISKGYMAKNKSITSDGRNALQAMGYERVKSAADQYNEEGRKTDKYFDEYWVNPM